MKFSLFCDFAEGTDHEQRMFELLRQEHVADAFSQMPAKLMYIPVLGKVLAAVVALAEAESITAFRQTHHYKHIMNWDVTFDFEKNGFTLTPSFEQKRKIAVVLSAIAGALLLLILSRKLGCCKKVDEIE